MGSGHTSDGDQSSGHCQHVCRVLSTRSTNDMIVPPGADSVARGEASLLDVIKMGSAKTDSLCIGQKKY